MLIEVTTPACLTLALVKLPDAGGHRLAWLGAALQQPPIQLLAQASAGLTVTGPRANVARQFAERFFQQHGIEPQGEVAIEMTTPRAMGLGSEPMLGLSVARALAWANQLAHEDTASLAQAAGVGPDQALALWGFEKGGLLLAEAGATEGVGLPPLLRRVEVAHADKESWVFVFYQPDTPEGTPASPGAARREALLSAAPHLSAESGQIVTDELWPAVERDDIAVFGKALMRLQALNQQALAAAGLAEPQPESVDGLLHLLRENGAVAWGQTPAGLAVFGLIRGATASIALRKKLTDRVGIFEGTVMGAIVDNQGARHAVKEQDLAEGRMPPIRQRR